MKQCVLSNEMKRFENKVVLVTGGSRNTGLDIVEKFVREGARVFLCGSTAASTAAGVEKLATRGIEGVAAQACDIGDPGQVKALFDFIDREAGRLDILVNNAADQGIGLGGPLEMDPESILKVMATNVKGGFQVTQTACNRFFMRQESRGVVVFLSSNTAQRAIRNRTAYCASKGAINSMVRSLALGVSTPGYCIHETLFDDVPWRGDVVDEDVKFVDGMMYPSDRPGLGIEIDEAAAAAHPKQDHWLRHYAGTLTNVRPPDSVKYYHAGK